MRIDVVTIFPDYLSPLRLSLIGRAVEDGTIDLRVHDLRDFATDRHRSVDDAPYGGGPGLVMQPGPWGRCLDDILGDGRPNEVPTLVFTTPAGRPFRQDTAVDWSGRPWLVFACGRYEGIDARVVEHYAERLDVAEVSIGDYVLAGGEVAALAMIEAVTRLVPGVLGNPDSAAWDSFAPAEGGLLEAPAYTRPETWRGISIPAVLTSGDHAAVDRWRRSRSVERTRQVRPDLLADPTDSD